MTINLAPVTMPRCHAEWKTKSVRAARDALRRNAKEHDDFHKSNLSADAIIEQVWNAIVFASGHDKKKA
jgi:hypothetical protein